MEAELIKLIPLSHMGDEPYRATCPELPIEEEKPVEGQAEKQGG